MPNRRFVTTRGFRRSRRETMWFAFTPIEAVIAAASTAIQLGTLNAAALALRPFTVIRMRGFFFNRSDQISSGEDYGSSFGMAVVSSQAAAVGVTAVPTPNTDRGSDLFFVYEEIFGHLSFSSGIGVRELGQTVYIDSKAMRKVNDDQDISITVETPANTDSAVVVAGGRFLIKLH